MDQRGAPSKTCFLCLLYLVYLLNHTAVETLAWRTPITSCFGYTPDLSPLLQFTFYEPVYFLNHGACFPETGERSGQFVGIAENKAMLSPTGFSLMTINFLPALWFDLRLHRNPTNRHLHPLSPRGVRHQILLHLT